MSKGRREPSDILSLVAEKANSLPLPERRAFLMRGLALAGATAAGPVLAAIEPNDALPPNIPPWTRSLGRGVVTVPYGMPSEFEANVIRRTVPWLTANNISSISFTPLPELKGIITPNGLVFERYHAGVPDIDPEQHRLMIHGMVERPLMLTISRWCCPPNRDSADVPDNPVPGVTPRHSVHRRPRYRPALSPAGCFVSSPLRPRPRPESRPHLSSDRLPPAARTAAHRSTRSNSTYRG